MKKALLLISSILILNLFTIGCENTNTQTNQPPKSENEYENLKISDINYNEEGVYIYYFLEYKSNSNFTTSPSFTIEKYDEQQGWTKTNLTDELVFIQVIIEIKPGEIKQDGVMLKGLKEDLQQGYYRIVKKYSTEDGPIVSYIQFEVKEDKILNFIAYSEKV